MICISMDQKITPSLVRSELAFKCRVHYDINKGNLNKLNYSPVCTGDKTKNDDLLTKQKCWPI